MGRLQNLQRSTKIRLEKIVKDLCTRRLSIVWQQNLWDEVKNGVLSQPMFIEVGIDHEIHMDPLQSSYVHEAKRHSWHLHHSSRQCRQKCCPSWYGPLPALAEKLPGTNRWLKEGVAKGLKYIKYAQCLWNKGAELLWTAWQFTLLDKFLCQAQWSHKANPSDTPQHGWRAGKQPILSVGEKKQLQGRLLSQAITKATTVL